MWVAAMEDIAEVMGLRRAKILPRVLRTQQNPSWLGIKEKRGWQELGAEKEDSHYKKRGYISSMGQVLEDRQMAMNYEELLQSRLEKFFLWSNRQRPSSLFLELWP